MAGAASAATVPESSSEAGFVAREGTEQSLVPAADPNGWLDGLDDLEKMSQDPPAAQPEPPAGEPSADPAAGAEPAAAAAASASFALVPSCLELATIMHAEPPVQPQQEEAPAMVDEKVCNLCEGRFQASEGVKKGARWWRCRPCIAAVQRLEAAAAGRSELAKKKLAQLKRNHKDFAAEVMKERATTTRGPANKKRIGAYLEELIIENSIQIDNALSFNRKHWIRARKCEGMSQEEAEADWEEAKKSGEYHVVEKDGETCIVELQPTAIKNVRKQTWKRSVQNERKDLDGPEAIEKAFKVARSLADWDVCGDPSFANAGGRLLRKPGAVPHARDGTEPWCPLVPLPLASAGEPSLSQDSAAGAAAAASSASGSGSPAARKPGTEALVQRQQTLVALRARCKSLAKAKKTMDNTREHENWTAFPTAITDNLGTDDLSARVTSQTAAGEALLKQLGTAGVESLSKLLQDGALWSETAAKVEDDVSDWLSISKGGLKEVVSEQHKVFAKKKEESEAKKGLAETYDGWPAPLLHPLYLGLTVQQLDASVQLVHDKVAAPDRALCVWPAASPCAQAFAEKLGARVLSGTLKLRQQLNAFLDSGTRLGALQHFQWASPVNERGPPPWLADTADALQLHSRLSTEAPPALTHPWMLAMQASQVLGGCHHIPLVGLGGFISIVEGSFFLVAMSSETTDDKEGHAWLAAHSPAARVEEYLTAHFWLFIVVKKGDVVQLPAGQTVLLLGLELSEDHPKNLANSAVWWPLPQLSEATAAPSQALHWSHTLAGIAANANLPTWNTFRNLEEVVADIFPSQSQGSANSGQGRGGAS